MPNQITRSKKWKWEPEQPSATDGRFGIREANLDTLKKIELHVARYFRKNGFPLEFEYTELEEILRSKQYRGRKLSTLDKENFLVLWQLLNVRETIKIDEHEIALFSALSMSAHLLGSHRLQMEPDLVRSKKVIAGAKKGAQKKLQKGLNPRNLSGTLAREFDLTARQITNILEKSGLRTKKSQN